MEESLREEKRALQKSLNYYLVHRGYIDLTIQEKIDKIQGLLDAIKEGKDLKR